MMHAAGHVKQRTGGPMNDRLPPEVEEAISWLEGAIALQREQGWQAVRSDIEKLDPGPMRARLLLAVIELARREDS
jgi:hypothetical protein